MSLLRPLPSNSDRRSNVPKKAIIPIRILCWRNQPVVRMPPVETRFRVRSARHSPLVANENRPIAARIFHRGDRVPPRRRQTIQSNLDLLEHLRIKNLKALPRKGTGSMQVACLRGTNSGPTREGARSICAGQDTLPFERSEGLA